MKILGIESSCDDTSVGVVEDGRRLLSNVTASSIADHIRYGGVVPEIAARSHIEVIIPVVDEALHQAKTTWQEIDGIAVTYGAGLGGSLLIGVLTARTLAITKHLPLYACNHVVGHIYANFLTESPLDNYTFPASQPAFPMLALIVSGGHTQLALFLDHFSYQLLGQTRDDAIGEAFDKVAKILGLPYPGGPSVEQAATKGNSHAFILPKAKLSGDYEFSFSGLKTAVLRLAQQAVGKSYDFPSVSLPGLLSEAQKADIAASFTHTAIETVVDKTVKAYQAFQPASVVIAGGVASSPPLRKQLTERLPISITFPDPKLCTDNGAMIATLGSFQAQYKQPAADPLTLVISPNLTM